MRRNPNAGGGAGSGRPGQEIGNTSLELLVGLPQPLVVGCLDQALAQDGPGLLELAQLLQGHAGQQVGVSPVRIHLARRGIDAAGFDVGRLMRFTEGWSGAEVEQCVVSALTNARLEDRELVDQDLLTAATRVVPLSRTMKEQIDHIRNWAYDRAVPARPDELDTNR